jgi:predicted aldo/keto reductase-like oxidoreductase
MGHNEEMLKKHEEDWKGKVSIVGLSVDDETEDVMKRIESKDWKRIKHYRFKAGWDGENSAIKLF